MCITWYIYIEYIETWPRDTVKERERKREIWRKSGMNATV